MKIVAYDDVDPIKVLFLNQLALDFELSPEMAARIRNSDPRPFTCLAIYAVEDDIILGQAGIFRLPMISTRGREDVGGIWAVATNPQYARRGVASLLLEEAHRYMCNAGLRFSSLGTDRYRVAYKLYRQHGYEEMNVWSSALTRWETAHVPTRLTAEPAGAGGFNLVEQIYQDIAKDYLGFAWRHTPFARLRLVDLTGIWILRENSNVIGYAITQASQTMLAIKDLVLQPGIDTVEAVAAVASKVKSTYVRVTASRPIQIASLKRAGYQVAQPTWSGFMIKSLQPGVTADEARQLYAIGTDRFLISWLDVT